MAEGANNIPWNEKDRYALDDSCFAVKCGGLSRPKIRRLSMH